MGFGFVKYFTNQPKSNKQMIWLKIYFNKISLFILSAVLQKWGHASLPKIFHKKLWNVDMQSTIKVHIEG